MYRMFRDVMQCAAAAVLSVGLAPALGAAEPAAGAGETGVEPQTYSVIILDDTGRTAEKTVVLDPLQVAPEFAAGDPYVLQEAKHTYDSGVTVTASTTHIQWEGEGRPIAIMDGDMETRWSSAYADNQRVTVDLGSLRDVALLRLHWERATPLAYSVAVSDQGRLWRTVYRANEGKEGPRLDELKLGVKARWLRLDLKARSTEWGFSLYEMQALTPADLEAEAAKAAEPQGTAPAAPAATPTGEQVGQQ